MSVETGLPIMRRTACAVDGHVFIHSGSSNTVTLSFEVEPDASNPPTHVTSTPRLGARCDCGLTRWETPESTEAR